MLLTWLSTRHSINMLGHTALGSQQSPDPPSLCGGKGSSLSGCGPPNDMVNSKSVIDVKPGDSGVVIGYQADEFTHTWQAECFVTQSQLYHGFMGKVKTLVHFPLEPGCEDYSFLDQLGEEFLHGLDSILMELIKTQELDASFDETDTMPSSVSSRFLHMVSTISDDSRPLFTPSIKWHNFWCKARVLCLPVPQAG